MFKKIFYNSIFAFLALAPCFAIERIYIDEEEMKIKQGAFYLHQGGNVWIHTHTVHRDDSGLYTFDHHIARDEAKHTEYQKQWKCPYCHCYWPMNSPCKNAKCPSKFK